MFSQKIHDRLMEEIERGIETADIEAKEKAKETLKKIQDNYRSMVMDKIKQELELAEAASRVGDRAAANQHKLRADIYKCVLDAAVPR